MNSEYQITKYKEWQEFDKIMAKNNIARKECLLLPFKAMLNALNS